MSDDSRSSALSATIAQLWFHNVLSSVYRIRYMLVLIVLYIISEQRRRVIFHVYTLVLYADTLAACTHASQQLHTHNRAK